MKSPEQIVIIHESHINGQIKQMVSQIHEYGTYEFWEDYKEYLNIYYGDRKSYEFFSNACIRYHKMKA